jgi:pimeloyl-ACP methyl ester carboxylesterase
MTDKENLLLLPGLLCDEAMWSHQYKYLSEVAEITIADFTRSDSMPGMAEAALSAVQGNFALAGLSMGGYVALEIMRRAPERVSKLALLDTSPKSDTQEQTERRHQLMKLTRDGNFDEVLSIFMSMIIHPARMKDKALCEEIGEMNRRVGPEAYVRQQKAIMGRPDSMDDLDRITCPTLVLCGRQDELTPPEIHEEIVSRIPNSRLAIIEDCAHLSTMEQPQAVTVMLRDWLLQAN